MAAERQSSLFVTLVLHMFNKVLIANRGEIACRIIRTCKRLGIKTVAIYSDADEQALHVQMADEAFRIGAAPAKDSYLRISRIVKAAKRAKADAIHPGYGFLSENPRFVEAVEKAKLTFIGPTSQVIAQMGDKVLARRLARQARVPVVPGSEGEIEDADAIRMANQIGYPLMVKAIDGGGGMGIRLVHHQNELMSAITRARNQAQSAFGSSRIYLERHIPNASHVEVQVLGDHSGNVVHLFERDCSVQRRHQKVLEETPCVKLSPQQRRTIIQAAVRLAKHIGYTNAGTVEFLVDRNGAFYFLEVNTRLQVEHPITEMVTGMDMVELQLRIAAGEELPISQKEIKRHGHALEARIYPEDPNTFLPVSGKVTNVSWPQDDYVRVDSAVTIGYEIKGDYEPLMAKLIVWGTDRPQAIEAMRKALHESRIDGVTTNIPALSRTLSHAGFLDSTFHTGFLEDLLLEPTTDSTGMEQVAAIAVAIVLNQNLSITETPSRWKIHARRYAMTARLPGGGS